MAGYIPHIPYIRGWVGMFVMFIGIAMLFFRSSNNIAPAVIGFGIGMMASGFQERKK